MLVVWILVALLVIAVVAVIAILRFTVCCRHRSKVGTVTEAELKRLRHMADKVAGNPLPSRTLSLTLTLASVLALTSPNNPKP